MQASWKYRMLVCKYASFLVCWKTSFLSYQFAGMLECWYASKVVYDASLNKLALSICSHTLDSKRSTCVSEIHGLDSQFRVVIP